MEDRDDGRGDGVVTFELDGARLRVRATGRGAAAVVAASLPQGSRAAAGGSVHEEFSVALDGRRPPHRLYRGAELLAECTGRDELVRELASRLDFAVAEHATERVYVHAGVVALGGQAIVIPGRSLSGKTTLVAALLQAGATFFSDEFAVIDAEGRVWPHARPLSIRPQGTTGPGTPITIEELGASPGSVSVPIGIVVATRYVPGATWEPMPLDRSTGLLRVLDNAIVAQTKPHLALSVLARAIGTARVLGGVRGEADDTAGRLTALVGQATGLPA